MGISYKPFTVTLAQKGLKITALCKELKISPTIQARFAKNENVSTEIIERLCARLDCQLKDIVEYIPDK